MWGTIQAERVSREGPPLGMQFTKTIILVACGRLLCPEGHQRYVIDRIFMLPSSTLQKWYSPVS